MLTAASARFFTIGNEGPDDRVVAVYVEGPWGRVAQLDGVRERFGAAPHDVPLQLRIVRGVTRAEVPSCRTRVHIDAAGDGWHFNYRLDLSFDDAPAFEKSWRGLTLDRDNCDFSDGLG
jgi:hypothetical protein